jgi:Tfp pilus assembly protein PilN
VQAINLLPRDDGRGTQRKGTNVVVLVGVIGAVLVTALVSGLFLRAHSKVAARQAELKSAKQELAMIPKPAQTQVQQQDALVADKQARVGALSAALARRVAWDRVLREFSLVLPNDVWLLNLSAKAPTSAIATGVTPAAPASSSASSSSGSSSTASAVPAATQEFAIEGYTYSHDAVARLLTRLAVVPDLTNVQLQSSERAKLGGRPIVHFRISADVKQPGGAS